MTDTCYMCSKPATSREHAPPRCLFPALKYSFNGKDQRVNLIVVPACDEHNGDKSADDQYLMHILPMSFGLNEVADHYFQSKVQESIALNTRLVKSLADSAVQVIVHDLAKNEWTQTTAFKVDIERLMSVLKMNAHAIYFHHHKSKLMAKLSSRANFTLLENSLKLNELLNLVMCEAEKMLDEVGAERHGANLDVFFYRIAREGSLELLEFTFYGTSKVLFDIDHSVEREA
ncbi:hypothetical protein [Pseudomonas viridiflava]|uniref:hypothetical protein n=1 Tax=Pseudomonas viridiflava TaxID=33069 RepID=UPI000F01EBED|nr:hypothetical protein [Pseudomonas viridiflava]